MGLAVEKPLLTIRGKTLIEHVLERIRSSKSLSRMICVTSPHTNETRRLVQRLGYEVVETKGTGYLEDLRSVLESLGEGLYATFSADVPFIDVSTVDSLLADHREGGPLDFDYVLVVVPEELVTRLGMPTGSATKIKTSWGCFIPTGLRMIRVSSQIRVWSVLRGPKIRIIDHPGFAVNVNTSEDLKRAEELAGHFLESS